MTRKTLTLKPEHVLGIKDLHPADRLLVYDTLINGFLLGYKIDYSNYPDTAKTALVLLMPQLRKLQTQHENGLKNKRRTKTGLLCPNDDTQNKPNTTTATHAHAYNNIPNLNKSFNNKYISNNQLTNNKYAQPCGEIEKNNNVTAENEPLSDEVQFYLDQVTERAEPLMQTEPKAANKLIEVAKYVTRVKNIKIQGQWMTAAEVLCKYVNIFRTPEPASKIASDLSIFFDSVASNIAKHEVKNASAYLAAALYLKASGLTA